VNTTPTPRRRYLLATWLSGGSLLIVFVALAVMAVASSIAVGRFARAQALARIELAVSSAREYFHRLGESNLVAARTLADRPTLARLLDEPGTEELNLYLGSYCREMHAADCIVLGPQGNVIATSVPVDNWPEIAAARIEQGERFVIGPRAGGPPIVGAAATVTRRPGFEVLTLQALSGEALQEAGKQTGATISLQNISTYRAPDNDPMTPLHAAALTNGEHAAARIPALREYAASAVMANSAGEPVALLDARLPTAEFDKTAATYRHVMIMVSLLVAILAATAGVLYGLWLASPVVRLAEMARRIGQGDFSRAVPTAAPFELDSLAHAMDDMRGNLIELTSTLRARESEAQAVLSGVVEGVFVTDEQRRIVYANPQFTRMVPATDGSPIGRFCGEVLHPTLAPHERPCERDCPIIAARARGAGRLAEQLRRPDGSVRSSIVVSAAPAEGRQVQLLRDETELEAARRARDSVLGNISHEFRTPLAAQLASIEMLRDGLATLTPAEQGQLLLNVERGVLRLMRLIDNLLESVRIESGQLTLRHQDVDMEALAREATELLRPLLDQASLQVSIELEALAGRPVPGDAQRLQQVFVNLLANAAKFAPTGTTIRIGAQRHDSQVEIWVEDEGPGPPPGDPLALFERFRRGENSEPDAPGLGLGLWIVRSIIERHSGSVRVERTAAARTRFVLSLPLGQDSADDQV
jgi:signal transduction histidine kinase/HAMP domain-containing protein